ncbi:response regulator transcription factor [Kutzneria sp. CA-103260]|uniref:response regulator transcription factor n=1 Tax=Kutzneria sp. CA-103260 TaxID=2802641 RepID=UPI001BA459DD|nr:response regulator transcription factor [Kutzneria sp. CA-103260]QUQ71286.1 LuxR family transcriptional regulator [Kutzneria sp. CA-103260]
MTTAPMTSTVRVLVVEDHPVTRAGIRASLDQHPGLTVVGEADNQAMACRVLDVELVHVVLVDLRLGDEQGMDLIEHLARVRPQARVLVLSQASPGEVLAALKAGAHGYVSKSATTAELTAAVLAVLDGPVLPPELAARLVGEFQHRSALTSREREVLGCLARGYDNREIAEELGVAVRTVNRHLENIREKLGSRRRSELIRLAREWDWNASA